MSTTTSNLERFVLEGPIGFPVAIVIALVLLVLFTISLGLERRILGRRYTVLFWILRATALGVAVWMLLAPTSVLVEISTTRKSVALLMDVSGSMQTIDPEGSSDDLRWAISQSPNEQFPATQAADQAYAAAGIAEKHLQQASVALVQHQRESLVVEATTSAQAAIARIRENLEIVAKEAGRNAPEAGFMTLTREIAKELEGSEFIAFGELCVALKKGRSPSEKGWRESLPDLQHRLTGIRRQLSELARDVAQLDTAAARNTQRQMLSSIQRAPRMGRAAGFLDSLSNTFLKTVQEKADVRISTFDQSSALLSGTLTATEFVRRLLPGPDKDTEEQNTIAAKMGTNISAVLEQLTRDHRDQPLAAAFILTDVSHNKVGVANPRQVAAALDGTPVYVIPIGNTQYVRDILVQSVFCPAVAMRNDDIVIEAVIQAYDCQGETCLVQLLQDGESIDSHTVQLDSDFATRRVRLTRRCPKSACNDFRLPSAR